MTARRAPHPLVTLAGWIVVGFVVGWVLYGVGSAIAWTDMTWGVKP